MNAVKTCRRLEAGTVLCYPDCIVYTTYATRDGKRQLHRYLRPDISMFVLITPQPRWLPPKPSFTPALHLAFNIHVLSYP
ncbi:hypothetical protein J6590_002506 [Homalodisca vitripennis]|nr:hypothetical protein J6590_002506 [Homalodisca vitripennis]